MELNLGLSKFNTSNSWLVSSSFLYLQLRQLTTILSSDIAIAIWKSKFSQVWWIQLESVITTLDFAIKHFNYYALASCLGMNYFACVLICGMLQTMCKVQFTKGFIRNCAATSSYLLNMVPFIFLHR